MGAVTNMRPDLFKTVVSHVPFVDVVNTMLDETLPLTVGEFEEWGNPKKKDEYQYMKRMIRTATWRARITRQCSSRRRSTTVR
jgi:protease II